jgi:hypothetical protein
MKSRKQDAQYPPTWQAQVHQLKETERKLLEYLAEVQRRVNESDEADVAARLASLGSILGYLEDSARQLVGLVQAFLRLQEETILQTRVQTLGQVRDEMDGLLQRLAGLSSSQAAHVGPPGEGHSPPGSGD